MLFWHVLAQTVFIFIRFTIRVQITQYTKKKLNIRVYNHDMVGRVDAKGGGGVTSIENSFHCFILANVSAYKSLSP